MALDHLRLCLRALSSTAGAASYGPAATQALASRPPGVIVMLDLLGKLHLLCKPSPCSTSLNKRDAV